MLLAQNNGDSLGRDKSAAPQSEINMHELEEAEETKGGQGKSEDDDAEMKGKEEKKGHDASGAPKVRLCMQTVLRICARAGFEQAKQCRSVQCLQLFC